MPNILTLHEQKRGCGFRQPGGLYLCASYEQTAPCDCLPIWLPDDCQPIRGWKWIALNTIQNGAVCQCHRTHESWCPVCRHQIDTSGLLWVGESFYPTTKSFLDEAKKMGFSKRIGAIPTDFILGQTWVSFAHRLIPTDEDGNAKSGVFFVLKPQTIEYVVKETDTDEHLTRLEQQGVTLVRIVKIDELESPHE